MNTFPELSALEMFYQELSDFLEKRKINFIYTDKKHQNLLCFDRQNLPSGAFMKSATLSVSAFLFWEDFPLQQEKLYTEWQKPISPMPPL